MTQSTQIYAGTPSTDKAIVYTSTFGRRTVVRQLVFTNTSVADAKITVTIDTVDVIKDYSVAAGKTEIIPFMAVIESEKSVLLQQNTANAINVLITGEFEQ